MKKIVGTIAAAALVASSAFAGVNVGSWNRSGADFNLQQWGYEKTETKPKVGDTTTSEHETFKQLTTVATPGFASGSRIGLNFSATSDDGNAGMNLNIDSNGGTLAVGDQAKIWGIIGFAKFQFGKIQVDDLRGSVGDWGNRQAACYVSEDTTFKRINPTGLAVSLTPVEGLFIGAGFDFNSTGVKTEKVLGDAQVQVGYTIADAVRVKAQFAGLYSGSADNGGTGAWWQAGADLMFIEGVRIEAGARFDSAVTKASVTQAGYDITISGLNGTFAVAAKGGADKLNYRAGASLALPMSGCVKGLDSLSAVTVEACAEYDIDLLVLGANAAWKGEFAALSGDNGYKANAARNKIDVEVYAKKNIGPGYGFVGIADTLTLQSVDSKSDVGTGNISTIYNNIKIPVGMEFGF